MSERLVEKRKRGGTPRLLPRVFAFALCLIAPLHFFAKPLHAESLHIGVASILGGDFQLIRVGKTAWERESHIDNVLSWNIDAYVAEFLSEQLGQSAGLNVDILQGSAVSFPRKKNSGFDLNRVLEAADEYGLDAVFVVRPATNVKAAHLAGGHGLYHNNLGISLLPGTMSIWSGPERRVFALVMVELIDAKRLGVVESIYVTSYSEELDVTYKPSLSEFSQGELELMERNLKEILRAEIGAALSRIDLSQLSSR